MDSVAKYRSAAARTQKQRADATLEVGATMPPSRVRQNGRDRAAVPSLVSLRLSFEGVGSREPRVVAAISWSMSLFRGCNPGAACIVSEASERSVWFSSFESLCVKV